MEVKVAVDDTNIKQVPPTFKSSFSPEEREKMLQEMSETETVYSDGYAHLYVRSGTLANPRGSIALVIQGVTHIFDASADENGCVKITELKK